MISSMKYDSNLNGEKKYIEVISTACEYGIEEIGIY